MNTYILSPRRQANALRLLDLIRQRGGKLLMTAAMYRTIRREAAIPPWQVDAAADDLVTLGQVEQRMMGGGTLVIDAREVSR